MLHDSMDNVYMMRFFENIPNNWLMWADEPNKLWGI